MASGIFVSYSHKDIGKVLPVIDALRDQGFDVWFDENLTPGVDWNEELAHAIEDCRVCLYFISAASVASPVCEREVSLAVRRDRYIVPVYLEDVPLSSTLEFAIGNLQAIKQPQASARALHSLISPLIQRAFDREPSKGTHGYKVYSHGPQPQKWMPILVVFIPVLVTVGYLAIDRWHKPANTGVRLAVLVFENFSGDSANDYLGSGVAEEIIDRLARSPVLQVVPRTASFYYHGKDIPFPNIADALDVDVLLEGSLLQREGDRLRFSTQLVDVRTNSHMWSQIYDVHLDALIQTKEEIARQVLLALAPEEVMETTTVPSRVDGEAYDEYLRGIEQLRVQHTRADLELAESLFRAALDKEPEFEPALSGLCQTMLDMYVLDRLERDYERASEICSVVATGGAPSVASLVALGKLKRLGNRVEEAIQYFNQALALDPSSEPALYGLARCFEAKTDYVNAERYMQQAIEALPRFWKVYTGYAGFLYRQGRYLEAAQQSTRVTELVPDNPIGWGNLGTSLFAADRWDEAATAWKRAFELEPVLHAYANLATLYYYQHRFKDARLLLEEGVKKFPQNHRLLGKLAATYRQLPDGSEDSERSYRRAYDTTSGGLRVNPDDAILLSYHAYFAAALGFAEEAEETIARARRLAPSNPEVYYHHAYVKRLLDDPNGWEKELGRALSLGYSRRQAEADPLLQRVRS